MIKYLFFLLLTSCNIEDNNIIITKSESVGLENIFENFSNAYKNLDRGKRNSKLPYCIIPVSQIEDSTQCLNLGNQQKKNIVNKLNQIGIYNIYIYNEDLVLFEYRRDFTLLKDNTYFIAICHKKNTLEKGLDFIPKKIIHINLNTYQLIKSKSSF